MKILITGIGGNVGRSLANYFAIKNSVVGVYRQTKPEYADYKVVQADLSEITWRNDENFDVVIHCAARLQGNTNVLIKDNIDATRNLVRYAEQRNISRFIYLSTVSVYGETDGVVSEDSAIINPEIYGMTKYLAENIVLESSIQEKIALELPRMLGPFVDVIRTKGSGFITMTRRLLQDEDVTCYIPEQAYNNYMHVSDLCSFIEKLLQMEHWANDRVLLGAKDNLPMMHILEIMKSAMGSHSMLVRGNTDVLPKCSCVSIERALKLGYTPRGSEETLHKFAIEMAEKYKVE